MSVSIISPKAFFALRSNVKQGAHFISDFHVLYPAGSVLVIHNFYENRQKYIKLYDKSIFLEFVAVSSNRKYAAIIENGEKGQIIVYDLVTLKKRRTLNLPSESTTNRFETLTFSHDDKFILAVTGEPDWMMVSYKWQKGKVDSLTRANYPNSPATVGQILCCPTDNSEVCLIGHGLFRLLTLNETVWRQYGFQKADQINITTGCWISSNRILCGTADGKLLVIDNAELRLTLNAYTVSVIQIGDKEEIGNPSVCSITTMKKSYSDANKEEDQQVRALISFAKGFAFSCKTGYVHMFEKISQDHYRKRNVFRIVEINFMESLDDEMNTIKFLSINVAQDKLLAATNRGQMYTVRLWGPDLHVAPEIPFRILGEPLHHGPIGGASMCVWKPLLLTCGMFDRTVRLWNYETETVDLVKSFSENIYSVSFHPTGHFLSVGFTDSLKFMALTMDDIRLCRDFPVSACPLSVFSWHGHLLAAVREGNIEIFHCITFVNTQTLNFPSGKVESMVWSRDDRKLIACGGEWVIVWDVLTGERLDEIVTEGVTYKDCAVSSDGKHVYVVGSDRLLKEICGSNILRSVQLSDRELKSVVMSRSDGMLFVADNRGCVLSVKMPMIPPYEFTSFFYHSSEINHMKLSFDDQTLVTASYGGAVVMWKTNRSTMKNISVETDFPYFKDILINKSHLQEKINRLKDLGVKLFDLDMSHSQIMRKKDNFYKGNIKEIRDNYVLTLEELKERIEQMEVDQESQLARINEEVNDLKKRQENEMEELKNNYGQKLSLEYEKIKNLSSEREEITNKYENELCELKESKEAATEDIIKIYEDKLLDIKQRLEQANEEKMRLKEEHSQIKQYFEEDGDREIVEIKAHYEKILKEERETNEVLKAEALNMRRKQASTQKEMDEYRQRVEALQAEHKKYLANIKSLENDIQDMKQEIAERDVTIIEKDKAIYELRKKIQELEKYKMVLDYKMKELRNQIDPKDQEIREKKEQIEDMEKELENMQKINTSLDLQQKELKEKIIATEKESANYEGDYNSAASVFRQIKVDLYNLYQSIDNFKNMKDGIKKIYLKYNQDDIFIRGHSLDTDLQKEFMVQREFLEKTIFALQSTLRKNKESKKGDGLKVFEDNVALIEELNRMRKELKGTLWKVRDLEKLINLKQRKSVTPKQAFSRLQESLRIHARIKKEYDNTTEFELNEMNDLSKRIMMLYERIEALSRLQ